jgi:transcriptional regulator with XRE-family HTH domain
METQQIYLANIKAVRRHLKLTQADMADKLGYTQSQFSKLEKGQTPLKTTVLFQICEIINLTLDQLSKPNAINHFFESNPREIDSYYPDQTEVDLLQKKVIELQEKVIHLTEQLLTKKVRKIPVKIRALDNNICQRVDCSMPIMSVREGTKYCSEKCRNKAWREDKKA